MILIIDNYDSFTYNLYQLIAVITSEAIKVVRNDEVDVIGVRQLNPRAIILSPGPGHPNDAGVCIDIIRQLGSDIPILGVCLGHQAIAVAYGGVVNHAVHPLHGKSRLVAHKNGVLFKHVISPFAAGRYHSLAVHNENLPSELIVEAYDVDGDIMALSHAKHKVYGIQFHPESILTPDGEQIMKNFLELCDVEIIH